MDTLNNVPVVTATMSNATYAGTSGKTPVKGVDYFTEADIEEIKSEIGIQVAAISNQEINALIGNLD